MDWQYVLDQISAFPHCELFSCSMREVKVVKEIQKGFISEIILECRLCQIQHKVKTSGNDGNLNVNGASVLGTLRPGL